jgi:exosortase A-associated hydrolase 1
MTREEPILFQADGNRLLGLLHRAIPLPESVGVVVVVGGPQYRVGSHRQFVLLARFLAERSIPVLRFDYSGMGDSTGETRTFENVDNDISAAVDALTQRVPQVRRVVLWGLCDGASAALMYAPRDPRVSGLVLLNPWVRTEAGLARSQLWTYYPRRLVSRAFWRKIVQRPRMLARSVHDFAGTVLRSGRSLQRGGPATVQGSVVTNFVDRMLDAAERFDGRTTVLLSGNDITAGEFRALLAADRRWRRAMRRDSVTLRELPGANHTFSSGEWRDWVAEMTLVSVRAC